MFFLSFRNDMLLFCKSMCLFSKKGILIHLISSQDSILARGSHRWDIFTIHILELDLSISTLMCLNMHLNCSPWMEIFWNIKTLNRLKLH